MALILCLLRNLFYFLHLLFAAFVVANHNKYGYADYLPACNSQHRAELYVGKKWSNDFG